MPPVRTVRAFSDHLEADFAGPRQRGVGGKGNGKPLASPAIGLPQGRFGHCNRRVGGMQPEGLGAAADADPPDKVQMTEEDALRLWEQWLAAAEEGNAAKQAELESTRCSTR